MSSDMSLFVLPQAMAQPTSAQHQLESTAPVVGFTHSRTISSDASGAITMPPPSTAAEYDYDYPQPSSNGYWSFPPLPQLPSIPIDLTAAMAPAGLASSPNTTQTPPTAAFPFATTAPPNTAEPTLSLGASSPWTPGAVPLSKPISSSPSQILADWSTAPSPYTAAISTPSPSPRRPPGPMRGFSTSAIYPRKRSIVSGIDQPSATSPSPATPIMAFTPFTPHLPGLGQAYRYPYSPPRQTSSMMETHTPLHRRPSAPILHPSPYTHQTSPNLGGILSKTTNNASTMQPSGGFRRLHPSPNGSAEFENIRNVDIEADKKAPRFKPSKEQLDILIAAYEDNKNPDGPTREALARQLGPDVRPKTLQIWFQNRRSKARAKEREANLPRSLTLKGIGFGRLTSPGPPRRGAFAVDPDALRALIRDDDPDLLLVPISVLTISSWTRFLTPGSGHTSPDLGLAIRLSHPPVIRLYVMHQSDTYRLTVPIAPACIARIHPASLFSTPTATPASNADTGPMSRAPMQDAESALIKFEMVPTAAEYGCWSDGEWRGTVDFTGGAASSGGLCEITGDREALVPAFTQVQRLLQGKRASASSATPVTGTTPISTFNHNWKYPRTTYSSSATTSSPFTSAPMVMPAPQRSSESMTFSASLPASAVVTPAVPLFSPDSIYSAESAAPSFSHLSLSSTPTCHDTVNAMSMYRQRSISAPTAPLRPAPIFTSLPAQVPLDQITSHGEDEGGVDAISLPGQTYGAQEVLLCESPTRLDLEISPSGGIPLGWGSMTEPTTNAGTDIPPSTWQVSLGDLGLPSSPAMTGDLDLGLFQSFSSLKPAPTRLGTTFPPTEDDLGDSNVHDDAIEHLVSSSGSGSWSTGGSNETSPLALDVDPTDGSGSVGLFPDLEIEHA